MQRLGNLARRTSSTMRTAHCALRTEQ